MIWLIYLVLGLLMGIIGIFYLIGPAARTIGLAHIFSTSLAVIPQIDRRMEFKRYRPLAAGWALVKGHGLHKLNQPKTYIVGGKCPSAIFPDGVGTNVTPEDAVLAELRAGGVKNPDIKVGSENVSFNDLIQQVKEAIGPAQLADLLTLAGRSWSPVEPTKKRISTLKLAGFGIIIIGVVVAIYLARMMGWIG